MFGSSIKVDLVFKKGQYQKEIRFPQNTKWLNLNTFEPIIAPKGEKSLSIMVGSNISDPVNMF
jgi:hypothetical protein